LSSVEKRVRGTVEEYTSLPYHLMLVRDGEDKGRPWTASVEELHGCTSHADLRQALDGIGPPCPSGSLSLREDREIPGRSQRRAAAAACCCGARTLHADLTRAS
jgi:hypothetical protein